MIKNLKTLLIIVLIVIAVVLNCSLRVKQRKIDKVSSENGVLADNLKSQVTIEKDKIIYKTRVNGLINKLINQSKTQQSKTQMLKDSRIFKTERIEDLVTSDQKIPAADEIKTQTKYLPPEGKAEIDTDLNGNTKIIIKDKGFCFEPSISVILAYENYRIGLAARFAYWNKYGLSAGITTNFKEIKPFVAVGRRIGDIIPFARNTTIGLSYDGKFGLNLNVFF